MRDEAKRTAALESIRQNIAQHGFHVYVVTGGGYPHYGYTIGLSESLGAELILAGSYFYRLDEVSKVVNCVARDLRSPVSWNEKTIQAGLWGSFSFRNVHASWAESLMLGVFDYYQTKSINAYQIVPDDAHRTTEIPDLSTPWTPESAPAWRWLHQEWNYPVPKNSVALTDLDALRGGRITEVMRWEADEWEIFTGPGPDFPESQRRVVPLGVLLSADSTLLPAVDLQVGCGFWRDEESDWKAWD